MSSRCFLSNFKTGLLFQEKNRKIDIQDGDPGGHLGFSIGTFSVCFYLQVTSMFPTKFHVNWFFVSGEKAKKRFSRWWLWRPSWNLDRNDFNHFFITKHSDASYQVSSQLAFWFKRSSEKYIFKLAAMAAILDFRSERF